MLMSLYEKDKTMVMVEDALLNFVQNNDKPYILYTFLIG